MSGIRHDAQVDPARVGHAVLDEGATAARLHVQASTGYGWTLGASDGAVVEVAGNPEHPNVPPERMVPGRGSVETWKLRGVRPGRQRAQLDYKRAWESDVAKSITLDIVVREASAAKR